MDRLQVTVQAANSRITSRLPTTRELTALQRIFCTYPRARRELPTVYVG
jgi:hypothetical protein